MVRKQIFEQFECTIYYANAYVINLITCKVAKHVSCTVTYLNTFWYLNTSSTEQILELFEYLFFWFYHKYVPTYVHEATYVHSVGLTLFDFKS